MITVQTDLNASIQAGDILVLKACGAPAPAWLYERGGQRWRVGEVGVVPLHVGPPEPHIGLLVAATVLGATALTLAIYCLVS